MMMNTRLFLKRRRKLKEHKDGSVNIRASILALGVGESARFEGASNIGSMRALASLVGREYGRKYRVMAVKGSPIEVTREM